MLGLIRACTLFIESRMHVCRVAQRWGLLAVSVVILGIGYPARAEVEGRLIVVTSFPETMFTPYKRAFESRHPRISVHFRNRKTSAAISFIQERVEEPVDLLWASAPDAFDVLKESGHLVRLFDDRASDARIGDYPLDDPEGYYRGFAVSGYGIMWNHAYLQRLGLPAPRRWSDLGSPAYYGHIGITAPSRSGTMHLIVEIILQSLGWTEGWATLLGIGGNLATITARSYGVADGVKDGRFGIGPVVDYFGYSARAGGASVEFIYPDATAFLPANIAMINRASNREAASAFVEFILSRQGQRILFEPEIWRLPVLQDIYRDAPRDYPNPFDSKLVAKGVRFDNNISRKRYHLVNSLFDIMITYRIKSLNRAWKAIHEAEGAIPTGGSTILRARLDEARRLATGVPVSTKEVSDAGFSSLFTRHKPGLPVPQRQIELEETWQQFARTNQAEALRIAREVLSAVKAESQASRP